MKKRVIALIFVSVLILSMFMSAGVFADSHDTTPPVDPATDTKSPVAGGAGVGLDPDLFKEGTGKTTDWLGDKYNLWLKGTKVEDLTEGTGGKPGQIDSVGAMIKWAILILIILLIYSALEFTKFPEQAVFRFIIAIVIGFLSTFFITTAELITAMQSYTALGIAMTVFIPIMILGFFTLVVASKANPMGIYLQKIMWLIYSVYLFFRAGILLVLKQKLANGTIAVGTGATATSTTTSIWGILTISIPPNVLETIGRYDTTMLLTLVLVALGAFIIMVVSNKPIIAWFAKEKRDAEIEGQKATIARSKAYDKARSKAMQDQ